jgi:hypothetical protein
MLVPSRRSEYMHVGNGTAHAWQVGDSIPQSSIHTVTPLVYYTPICYHRLAQWCTRKVYAQQNHGPEVPVPGKYMHKLVSGGPAHRTGRVKLPCKLPDDE